MKHFTRLLTLCLALAAGQAAYAQLGVRLSTDDVEYEYYIGRHVSSSYVTATSGGTEATDLYIGGSNQTQVKFIFKAADTDGYVKIYATNILKDADGNFIDAPVIITCNSSTTIDGNGIGPTYQVGAAEATPAVFRLNPVSCTAGDDQGKVYLQMNLITDSEGSASPNTSSSTWCGENGQTIKFKNSHFGSWFVWYVEAAAPAPITFSSYTEGALSTYSTAIAADISALDVTAYVATGTTTSNGSTTLKLQKITDGIIPAGVGVLLENAKTTSDATTETTETAKYLSAAAYPTTTTSTSSVTSKLTATTVAVADAPVLTSTTIDKSATGSITIAADGDDNTTYVLGNPTGGSGVGFYALSDESRTVPAYKAYLVGPKKTSSDASAIKLQFPDGTTGILRIDGTGVKDAPVYDLAGRRVAKPMKGNLYIQGGKKFFAE